MSTARTPNWDEGLSARSTITGQNEYLLSTNGALDVSASVTVPPPVGAANFGTGQQALSGTAAEIVAIRLTRTTVTIVNLSTTDVYIGDSGVTTSTGQLLLGTKGSAVTLATTAAVYGIVATGTPSVSFEEEYS